MCASRRTAPSPTWPSSSRCSAPTPSTCPARQDLRFGQGPTSAATRPPCVRARDARHHRHARPEPHLDLVRRALKLDYAHGHAPLREAHDRFSPKLENLASAVSLHYMHNNFCRPHATLIERYGKPHDASNGGRRGPLPVVRAPARRVVGVARRKGHRIYDSVRPTGGAWPAHGVPMPIRTVAVRDPTRTLSGAHIVSDAQ